jgi:outer membrane protein insertion porin family
MLYRLLFITLIGVLSTAAPLLAQETDTIPLFDYSSKKEFEIGGITVVGNNYSDENAIVSISGLKVGDKVRIPGNAIPKAIKALWRLRLFTDVQIHQEKTIGDVIFLEIIVEERPRLSVYSYLGVKKSLHDNLNEEVDRYLLKGGIVTDNVKVNASEAIEEYFIGKGYLDARVSVEEFPDSSRVNSVRLEFNVDRGERVKIQNVAFTGNDNVNEKKLRKQLDNTKKKGRLFGSSKFIQEDYEADKQTLVTYYNNIGFRDARILGDSVWREEDGDLKLLIKVDEGNRYFFRDIEWKGNSIYDSQTLTDVLGIQKGMSTTRSYSKPVCVLARTAGM